MSKKEKKRVISQEDVMKILDSCYEKCLNGIPKVSPSVEEMANDYLIMETGLPVKIEYK